MTPDPGWPGRPFTIVVGTGEHRFARVSNRALADAFRAAYAQHAQAVPPLVDDGVDPATLAGRDLLCVGNPRSHRLLARLVADGLALEAAWDHRSVSWRGSERLRAASGCLKLTAIDRQRTVLVLDGGIPAWGPDQPLAGLPDGFLRAASVPTAAEPEGPPAPAPGPEPAPPPAAEPAR
jgi:hypothetical protein